MKAVFEFQCSVSIPLLRDFFNRKNIAINYFNINQKLNEHRAQVARVFLDQVNPNLISGIELRLSDICDKLIFYTLPLKYILSDNGYVLICKVPYMKTPLIMPVGKESQQYELRVIPVEPAEGYFTQA